MNLSGEKTKETSKNAKQINKNKTLFLHRPNYFFGKMPRGIMRFDSWVDEYFPSGGHKFWHNISVKLLGWDVGCGLPNM